MESQSLYGEVWREFRRLMPVTQKWAYLDDPAVAPLPFPAPGRRPAVA